MFDTENERKNLKYNGFGIKKWEKASKICIPMR